MRNTKNDTSDAAIIARREYKRNWRKKNREHIQAYNAEYWRRKLAEADKAPGTQ